MTSPFYRGFLRIFGKILFKNRVFLSLLNETMNQNNEQKDEQMTQLNPQLPYSIVNLNEIGNNADLNEVLVNYSYQI